MHIVPIAHARYRLTELVEGLAAEPTVITRNGQAVAVMVAWEDYEHLIGRASVMQTRQRSRR
ncbi:MAG: type II toxin-antitoxin system Phd/YefM family antitoxin [Candidatus Dormibacteraeota bacterium]|uniref:Antitoxin n=1 Tax=Candidatus Dormiibacter inghamiae TaxID=3127013 RepID=A0A934KHX9_9BACT|nr:type II toxin-antitoxin system Phd/YefM family antitoxin [Candidatus Dormibacteraeota bacterium]MBJ7606316.1 type II toxin-antitoxin system Phd/YefM family antitoxin [Candidatus Dormibacteraeota bacterium]